MIRVSDLSKSFGTKLLFGGVSYQFPIGERVALVGANGVGKTTFLRILGGEIEADEGRVDVPRDTAIGYLPQEPNPNPKETIVGECAAGAEVLRDLSEKLSIALKRIETDPSEENVETYSQVEAAYQSRGGYGLEAEAKSILSGLGFAEAQFGLSPKSLSGGWRMRLELARLFINRPDLLILDEPTNHLDLPALAWVESFLERYEGTLLFVSHDRTLLNKLSTHTLELSHGKLTPYKGNFDSYLDQKEQLMALDAARLGKLQDRRKHLEKFVERFGAKASKAKQAQSRVKMIDRLRSLETNFQPDASTSEMFFKIPEPVKSGRVVLEVNEIAIGYDRPLMEGLGFKLERGMKIAVVGANGLGKSTLLKTIHGLIPRLAGSVEFGYQVIAAYFAQDQLDELDGERTVLENVLAANTELGESAARRILGNFLFSGQDVFKPVKVLSGGEKSRVGLARTIVSRANFLLLDEPTNHLDMSSVEILAEALAQYKGSCIFVSHDRGFVNQLATHTLVLAPGGQHSLFEGDLDSYRRLAAISGFPDIFVVENEVPASSGSKARKPRDQGKELHKKKSKIEKKIAKLDTEMESIRNNLSRLEMETSAADETDYEALSLLTEQRNELEARMEEAESSWIDASEELERVCNSLVDIGRN